ncbi:hypothetical protein ACWCQ1_43385 [Streptomyces sp. NPDC002144]
MARLFDRRAEVSGRGRLAGMPRIFSCSSGAQWVQARRPMASRRRISYE